jgi:hypothetical protein
MSVLGGGTASSLGAENARAPHDTATTDRESATEKETE